MRLPNYLPGLAALLFLPAISWGQGGPGIMVPPYADAYCRTVQQLEAGQPVADYQAFRASFLESEQFRVASRLRPRADSLERLMYAQMKSRSYPAIIRTTQQLLSLDYTNLLAHKILQQTYKIMGDTASCRKYHDIEFGLLRSITGHGDGKTCATAWPVTQLSEEYFMLKMLDATLLKQSVDHAGGLCDKMEVQTPDGKRTYYFEVSQVFAGYRKLGLK